MRGGGALLAALLLAPAAGVADGQGPRLAERRAACRPFVTIQYEGCAVETRSRCPDGRIFGEGRHQDPRDPASLVPSATLWTADADAIFAVDPETGQGLLRRLSLSEAYSLAELLAEREAGHDGTWAWRLPDGLRPSRVRGRDRLTGESVVIDGRSLLLGESERSAVHGEGGPSVERRAEILVDVELGIVLGGRSEEVVDGAASGPQGGPQGGRPAAFIFPGEPGFGARTPSLGCGATSKRSPA